MQTYLSKILNNCDEVTQHVLQKKEVEFSLRKQIEIKIHVMMCRCCKNFEKQSEVIDDKLKLYKNKIQQFPMYKAPQQLKDNLEKIIS